MKLLSNSIHRSQQGWSLVELLVAMTLSLVAIDGAGQIYLSVKRSYDIQTSLARLQDVGRYATDLLTYDIHMAGFWGLAAVNDPLTVVTGGYSGAESCPAGNTDWGSRVTSSSRIFGFNDTNPSSSYACITSWERGDVLTVRYADPTILTIPSTATALYIRTSLSQAAVSLGPPTSSYASPTADHALVAHAYYISSPASLQISCGASNCTLPQLARVTLAGNCQPNSASARGLGAGVEQLQFQFGVDTDNDGSVNQYLNANQVTAWDQVRAVRFWVLARSDCPEAGYVDRNTYVMGNQSYFPADGYRRALYTSTVALRN